jgi:hypothetical protein
MYSYKQRHAVWQKIPLKGILLPIFILGVLLASIVSHSNNAIAATSNTLNFQGRLLTNSGALVADGSYNIEFKVYDSAATGASAQGVCSLNSTTDDCWWIESQTVTVQNGYFSVALGSVTAFSSTVPWDQELWLTMNVSSDGEMSPRFKLTAVPYAFRAGGLVDSGGNFKDADDFAQLSPSAVQTLNTAVAALRLNQTGSGSLLQLQGNGSDVFTVDKSGNTVLGAGITLGNSSSTTAGTIRWNGSAFQGYNGSLWTSLGSSGAVVPFVSKTKTADETQNNVVNPTATLQNDDELSFSIGANETWNFRFSLLANANATPDIKFAVTAPVGATCKVGTSDPEGATSIANLGCGVSTGLVPGNTTEDVYEVVGSVTNGANAGTITLQWAQNTANVANTIVRSGSFVEATRSVGGSSVDVAFIQNGNSFGGLAVLGTNDSNGLSIETNGVERLQVLSTGEVRLSDDIIANRVTTGVTGTTSGTGTNTTTLVLTADVFSVNDVVLIDNVGQDYYTRITVDPGTGSYTVSPAVTFENSRTVTRYTIQNIGATNTTYTDPANRFFQGYFLGGVVVGAGSTTISDGMINSTTDLTLQSSGGNVVLGGGLNVTGVISGDASGLTNIDGSDVSGSTITGINASNISSGTLADARLSANVTLLGNTFNGSNQLVRLDGSSNLPALNGSSLTSLSAGNLTGSIAAIDGSALTNLTSANLTGALPAISGANLLTLNASSISSGTLGDSYLSTNVILKSGAQTLTGTKTFDAGLTVTNGQNFTVGGQTYTDLKGTGLLNTSGILNVAYGSSAGTAVQGNTSLTCPSGTGNLSGGGTTITLGSGGSCSNISITNSPTFSTSVSSPLFTGSGAVSLSSGGSGDLTLTSASGITIFGNTTQRRAGGLTFELNNAAADTTFTITNTDGTYNANLSVEGSITGASFSGNGSSLTALNASNVSSGSLSDARLSANVALLNGGQTFSALTSFGAGLSATGNISASGQVSGLTVVGDGSGLTSLNATNVSSGTLADARLSSNVALLTGSQSFSGTKSFTSGGLVLGQSTIGSLASSARTVNFPDEAGTICLSNSNNCGFLRIAAGSLQTDASNNDVLAVNKTSATGNLISLQRSGSSVLTVSNSGSLQIQSTATAALDIRNAGGTSYFSIDTSTGTVRVGASTADATGVLFVLDTKNTTGDPAIGSLNNARYYNSADAASRCYENSYWSDCFTTRVLGETTLGAAGATISITLSEATEYLQCRIDTTGQTAAVAVNLRFNNDSGAAAYQWNTYSIVAAAVVDGQDNSDSEIQLTSTDTDSDPISANITISNFSSVNKSVNWTSVISEPVGTNNNRYSGGGVYYNVASQITSVQFVATGGNFNSGSHAWCEGRNIR